MASVWWEMPAKSSFAQLNSYPRVAHEYINAQTQPFERTTKVVFPSFAKYKKPAKVEHVYNRRCTNFIAHLDGVVAVEV